MMRKFGDENDIRVASHENRMVAVPSPTALNRKSDRLSLFNLVEDVETAKDQLKFFNDGAKQAANEPIRRKSVDKRGWGGLSPKGDRLSAQKRHDSKCSPGSLSFASSSPARNSSDRRMTVDPADLAAMMKELEDEENEAECSIEDSMISSRAGSRAVAARANPVNSSLLSEMSTDSPHRADKSCMSASFFSEPSLSSEAFGKLQSGRRTTCDPLDILAVMADLDNEKYDGRAESDSNRRTTCDPSDILAMMEDMEKDTRGDKVDRRMTADPADMAAIMLGLEEEDAHNKHQQGSVRGSGYKHVQGPFTGRESMDTVYLVESVGHMLRELEEGESASNIGGCAESGLSKVMDIRTDDSNATDESLSLSSTASDSDETMGTMALIANVQSAIDTHSDDDDDTIMTSSSFGSIGGLLNMVAKAEQQPSKKEAITTQSPRRSSRLSTIDESRSVVLSVLGTPSKGPSTSPYKGLRSCMASRTKATSNSVAPSPAATSKRYVAFGSPKVAEFNKTSPATNMTPMRKEAASKLFSMKLKEDEEKADVDNSDEWDRLTNTSGGSPNQSEDELSPLPVPGSPAFNRRYYTSNADSPASIVAEYSSVRRSPRRKASPSKSTNSDVDLNASVCSDVTGTVDLPNSLRDLMSSVEDCMAVASNGKDGASRSANAVNRQAASTVLNTSSLSIDQTEVLEADLQSLIHRNREICPMSDVDDSCDHSHSRSLIDLRVADESRDASHFSEGSVPSLGPLLGLSSHSNNDKHCAGAENVTGRKEEEGDYMTSSPMSSVGSNESLVSFKKTSESDQNYLNVSTSTWEPTTQFSPTANVSQDGVTVELECRLQDLIEDLGSPAPAHKKMKNKKVKKRRAPLRNSTSTPSMKYSSTVEHASPWLGDMSVISNVDDDHTERLEGNLGDLLSSVESPSMDRGHGVHARETQEVDTPLQTMSPCVKDSSPVTMPKESDVQSSGDVAGTPERLGLIRSSDIDYLNLISAPGIDTFSFTDMSVCADRSVDMSTARVRSTTVEGVAMMRRLSVLNAGARMNTLNQCATPLAAKGSMSIGMKRHSLSVTRYMAQSNSKKSRASMSAASVNASVAAGTFPSRAAVQKMSLPAVQSQPVPTSPTQCIPSDKLINTPIISEERESTGATATSTPGSKIPVPVPTSSSILRNAIHSMIVVADVEVEVGGELESCKVGRSDVRTPVFELIAEEESEVEVELKDDECVVEDIHVDVVVDASDGHQHAMTIEEDKIENNELSTSEAYQATALPDVEEAISQPVIGVDRDATEKAESILLSQANKLSANLAGKEMLKSLQIQLKEARTALDKSSDELRTLQGEVSLLLEKKKDHMISLIEQKECADKDFIINQEIEKLENEQLKAEAAIEIRDAEKLLQGAKQAMGLLNRVTYCRVLRYQSTVIEIEAVLSSRLRVQLIFNLTADKNNGKLIVDGTHVDLKYVDSGTRTPDIENETFLASAYFSDIMCSGEVQGPLSEGLLSGVACPSDIPATMMRISGFVSSFRRCSTWLDCFSTKGWKWSVEGVSVVIRTPTKYTLSVPLRVIVAGDVRGVSYSAMKDKDGAVVFEAELRIAINIIQQRCNSPFGSFPSGQLMQAVEEMLQNR